MSIPQFNKTLAKQVVSEYKSFRNTCLRALTFLLVFCFFLAKLEPKIGYAPGLIVLIVFGGVILFAKFALHKRLKEINEIFKW